MIRDRLKVYHDQTAVVSDFYAAQGKYASVDGIGSIDEVFDRIAGIVDNVK